MILETGNRKDVKIILTKRYITNLIHSLSIKITILKE